VLTDGNAAAHSAGSGAQQPGPSVSTSSGWYKPSATAKCAWEETMDTRDEGREWFKLAGKFDESFTSLPQQMKSASLRPVAEIFVKNMATVGKLAALPIDLTFQAHRAGYTFAHAYGRLGKIPVRNWFPIDPLTKAS
jgi:hypothetical protein